MWDFIYDTSLLIPSRKQQPEVYKLCGSNVGQQNRWAIISLSCEFTCPMADAGRPLSSISKLTYNLHILQKSCLSKKCHCDLFPNKQKH